MGGDGHRIPDPVRIMVDFAVYILAVSGRAAVDPRLLAVVLGGLHLSGSADVIAMEYGENKPLMIRIGVADRMQLNDFRLLHAGCAVIGDIHQCLILPGGLYVFWHRMPQFECNNIMRGNQRIIRVLEDIARAAIAIIERTLQIPADTRNIHAVCPCICRIGSTVNRCILYRILTNHRMSAPCEVMSQDIAGPLNQSSYADRVYLGVVVGIVIRHFRGLATSFTLYQSCIAHMWSRISEGAWRDIGLPGWRGLDIIEFLDFSLGKRILGFHIAVDIHIAGRLCYGKAELAGYQPESFCRDFQRPLADSSGRRCRQRGLIHHRRGDNHAI